MIPTCEEMDAWVAGAPPATLAPPGFVPGGDLAMRPSNMGIPSAARASNDLVTPATEVPLLAARTGDAIDLTIAPLLTAAKGAPPGPMSGTAASRFAAGGVGSLRHAEGDVPVSLAANRNMGIQSAVSNSSDLAVKRAIILRRNRTAGIVPPRRDEGEHHARFEVSSGAAEQGTDDITPPSQLRRINEVGDAVPVSQDSELALQAQGQLRISAPTSGNASEPVQRQTVGRPRRREDSPVLQRWQGLQCCMCSGGDVFHAHDSRGLLLHMVRAHLGQSLTAEAVAQLRVLDKAACQICTGIRARATPYCQHCRCATLTRPLVLGDIVPDRRRPAPNGVPLDATTANAEPMLGPGDGRRCSGERRLNLETSHHFGCDVRFCTPPSKELP